MKILRCGIFGFCLLLFPQNKRRQKTNIPRLNLQIEPHPNWCHQPLKICLSRSSDLHTKYLIIMNWLKLNHIIIFTVKKISDLLLYSESVKTRLVSDSSIYPLPPFSGITHDLLANFQFPCLFSNFLESTNLHSWSKKE